MGTIRGSNATYSYPGMLSTSLQRKSSVGIHGNSRDRAAFFAIHLLVLGSMYKRMRKYEKDTDLVTSWLCDDEQTATRKRKGNET
jgi:hypothetical protein